MCVCDMCVCAYILYKYTYWGWITGRYFWGYYKHS